MKGLWFNHEDFNIREKKHERVEILTDFGFTDVFVLIKGETDDFRNDEDEHKRLSYVLDTARRSGMRIHGVFICSVSRVYIQEHPECADFKASGLRSDMYISHADKQYKEFLKESILSAMDEYELDGVQLDFLRFGNITGGWSKEEEEIYRSYGVDTVKLKDELVRMYNELEHEEIMKILAERFDKNDEQLLALSQARRKMISDYAGEILEPVRKKYPGVTVSAAMMPEWLSKDQYAINELYYGQDYYDFGKIIDILFPMIYAGVYMKKSDWVGELAGTSSAEFPGAVIGLECSEPRTAGDIKGDVEVLRDKKKKGLCFFRYGRIILARREGEDTILLNTYPGTVYRMILIRGDEQKSLDCRFEEDSLMTVPGNWDMIRAFGTFSRIGDEPFEGELCTLMS